MSTTQRPTSSGPAVADLPRAAGGAAARGPEPAPRHEPEAPARPSVTAREAPPARRLLPFAVLGVMALLGIALGVRQYLWAMHHVRTDNAQVEGHVIPVLAKVSGYVTAVRVADNQSVRSGETLVEIDDREYAAKLAQSEADLAAAVATAGSRGRVGQAMAQLEEARTAVQQAEANAARARDDAERYRALAARGVVSRQQLDAAETAVATTQAQLDGTRKQVQAGQAAVLNADAKVAAARAQRDQAALNLAWARIESPRSGVVSRKNVEPGQLVSPGQPLMSVVPLDDVWAIANLKETEIAEVNPGDRAEIEVDAYPGRRFAARVESVAAATGAKFSLLPPDNATGNFTKVVQRIPVKLRLTGAPDPAHPLRPGMSVQATITTR